MIFGAGTIDWSWGLDSHHDFDPEFSPKAQSSTELAMQQATVNLFADMCDATGHCVQPRTLQPGLTLATASTDSTPPTSTITSPANGGTVVIGSLVSIAGTAVDSGGGVVGGVEVSVDGGLTWHPATDRTWKYSWRPTLLGPTTIQSRAIDDTGNLEKPVRSVNVAVVPRSSEILLFYNQTNGNQAIGRLNNIGDYLNLSAGVFDPIRWTHIVTGINNVLFFYRSTDGYTWTGKLDDAGNYTDIGQALYPPSRQEQHTS
ncbi:MAG: Ig-like domain-containing protein [Methylocella sp.]